MNDLRVRAVVGPEVKADTQKVLLAGGESSVLRAVFTPKKTKMSPRHGSVHDSDEYDSWKSLWLKPSSPPHLQDLGAVIEVMSSPSSVKGKALNFHRALEDIGTNFGKLRTFASEQQIDISDTFDDVMSKFNTLSLGHDTLDQRVGLTQGFGVSSVFEGLHDEVEDFKVPFRKFPYAKMVEPLGTFETDLEGASNKHYGAGPQQLARRCKVSRTQAAGSGGKPKVVF
jgi:hypothetical protein